MVEVLAVSLLLTFMVLLMPCYPKLDWWEPILIVGLLALFRGIRWLVGNLFGMED